MQSDDLRKDVEPIALKMEPVARDGEPVARDAGAAAPDQNQDGPGQDPVFTGRDAAGESRPPASWARRLLAAYQASHRDLPWRRTRDPYAIYVSEIMLQQTQVQTVIPYYERFLARFPDAAALAAADPDELHKYWEGLGYYARARQMQKAAAQIVAGHGGRLPDDPGLLRELPGIGAYTVGAIRSIAFGHAEPAVDGNVVRVIARLYALPLVQGAIADRERVAALVQPLIPPEAPGDFNQALMDLGARICTPARPRCADCPVQSDCRALKEGQAESLPLKQPRKTVPEEEWTVVVLKAGDRFHVQRRSGSLLKGLYQFDLLPGRLDAAAVSTWLLPRLAPGATFALEPLPDRIHRFTHRLWRLGGFACTVTRLQLPGDPAGDLLLPAGADGGSLVTASELAALPFPTALSAYRSDVLAAGPASVAP